jgi:hypothetical protein
VPTQADSWSTIDSALGFGLPIAVFLVGVTVFLGGRSERRALHNEEQEQAGGFAGPPGTTDVGQAEGFGLQERRQLVLAASRKVLIGLFIMLAGLLALLAATLTRLLS